MKKDHNTEVLKILSGPQDRKYYKIKEDCKLLETETESRLQNKKYCKLKEDSKSVGILTLKDCITVSTVNRKTTVKR